MRKIWDVRKFEEDMKCFFFNQLRDTTQMHEESQLTSLPMIHVRKVAKISSDTISVPETIQWKEEQ